MSPSVVTPPAKLGNGYVPTAQLQSGVTPAKLTPEAFPFELPKSIGYSKSIGNMNTYKVAALDALDPSQTFRATGGFEQAVMAASELARTGRGTIGATRTYAVLEGEGSYFVTPLWLKNPRHDGKRIGVDVDRASDDANEMRGQAAKASTPEYVASVGRSRWIDLRPAR